MTSISAGFASVWDVQWRHTMAKNGTTMGKSSAVSASSTIAIGALMVVSTISALAVLGIAVVHSGQWRNTVKWNNSGPCNNVALNKCLSHTAIKSQRYLSAT